MPLREHIEQRGKNIPLAKAKPSKSESLCVTLRKNFAHFAVKKISLFLDRDVSSENQFYLPFDMPLREHIEQRVTIGGQKK
jgi:hypothetical protein